MENQILTFTVLLADGNKIQHIYELGLDEESTKFLDGMIDIIGHAWRKSSSFLGFHYPDIIYNPDRVSGVQIDFIGAEEFQEAVRRAQDKLGFIKG